MLIPLISKWIAIHVSTYDETVITINRQSDCTLNTEIFYNL